MRASVSVSEVSEPFARAALRPSGPASEDENFRHGYAAFGHVVEGMDVVRAIFDAPVDPEKGEGWMKGQMLAEPVKILSARRAASN